MKRVIITGASGYIGGELAKRLMLDGVAVWGVGRDSEKLGVLKQYGDFHPVIAEFESYGKLDVLIPERGFDCFYHLAWRGTTASDRDDYNDYNVQLANVKATCNAAHSAAGLGCCRCSSISSYQEADVITHDYQKNGIHPFNPVYYGILHRSASEMFKAISFRHSIPCVNLIFPNTYGIGDKPNTAIISFIKNMLHNKPLNLISGEHTDDWMPVQDLVDGIVAAATSNLNYGDYYIGHRSITTFKEKLIEMKQILNSSSDLNWGKYPENYYVDYARFDLDALYRDTGWEAKTSFADSVKQVAKWLSLP